MKMADLVVSVMTEAGARPCPPGSDLIPLCPSAALISEDQKFDCKPEPGRTNEDQ